MAVPARMFVGLTVFGLIVCLMVIPITLLVLSNYQPPPGAPHEVIFPGPETSTAGTKVFLVAASLFCIAFTVLSWRALLAGARQGAGRGGARPADPAAARAEGGPRGDERPPPPGYQ